MLYRLRNTVTGEVYNLDTRHREYIVGRKNADILLENDQSISRKHAIIQIKDDSVILKDCQSKYRTYHKGRAVDPDVEITLSNNDTIQFGMLNSKFCFEVFKYVTTVSSLSSEKKKAVKRNLEICGGIYMDKWSTCCTHLTVDKITLTMKVLQALIDEKPLVIPEFWEACARSIQDNTDPPDITSFNKPPVAEQVLRPDFEIKPDSKRRTLFGNKVFLFLKSSTKNQMKEVIKMCGGECIAWEEEQKTIDEINSSLEEYLIMKPDDDEEVETFIAFTKKYVEQNKRLIPLNEIALAIFYSSCEMNCNPSFNKLNQVFRPATQRHQSEGILAGETESDNLFSRQAIKTERIIPPTLEDDWDINVSKEGGSQVAASSSKRPNDEKEEGVFKKPKLEKNERKQEKEKAVNADKENEVVDIDFYLTPVKTEDTSIKNKPAPPSQKRKAEEPLEASGSKKLNPFSLIRSSSSKKSQVTDDNPFELSKKSISTKSSTSPKLIENPFSRIAGAKKNLVEDDVPLKQEIEKKPKQDFKKEIRLIPITNNVSYNISSTKRSVLSGSWISKNNSLKCEIVKEEDPELEKIVEAFKDCVKVQVLMSFRSDSSCNISKNTTGNISSNGKNFKKFRKVAPLKPQIHIISRKNFTKFYPDETKAIVVNERDSDDELLPELKPQLSKSRSKKFVL